MSKLWTCFGMFWVVYLRFLSSGQSYCFATASHWPSGSTYLSFKRPEIFRKCGISSWNLCTGFQNLLQSDIRKSCKTCVTESPPPLPGGFPKWALKLHGGWTGIKVNCFYLSKYSRWIGNFSLHAGANSLLGRPQRWRNIQLLTQEGMLHSLQVDLFSDSIEIDFEPAEEPVPDSEQIVAQQ